MTTKSLPSMEEAIQRSVKSLEAPFAQERADAAIELGLWHDRRALEPLVRALDDPDPVVRAATATALGMLGDESAVESLVRRLDDTGEVRAEVIRSLSLLGNASLAPHLVPLLDSPCPQIRLYTMSALDNWGCQSVIPRRLLRDPDVKVRCQAIQILYKPVFHRDPNKLMPEEERDLRLLLDDPDVSVRTEAWRVAEVANPSLLHGRQKALEWPLPRPTGRSWTADDLIEYLQTTHPCTRSYAARELGFKRDSRATKPLLAALDDADRHVRAAAAHSLGEMGREYVTGDLLKQVVERLEGLLQSEHNEVILAAIQALGQLGDSQVGPKILPFIDYPYRYSQRIRWAAIDALHRLRYLPAAPYIRRRLRDPLVATRMRAMLAMLDLGREAGITAEDIQELVHDDPVLRGEIEVLLKKTI